MVWVSKVDLPMPGSPPSRVTEPCTRPPPSTRSSSPMPVLVLASSSCPTSPSDWMRTSPISAGANPALLSPCCAALSTIVFHSPQSVHWPAHLLWLAPQLEHMYSILVLAISLLPGWFRNSRSPAPAADRYAPSAPHCCWCGLSRSGSGQSADSYRASVSFQGVPESIR